MPRLQLHLSAVVLLAATLLLSACAGYAPNNGMLGNSREQVIQVMGQPSTELTTPEGRVMQYPRGPFGKHTYFVYLNSDDEVMRWTQVLDEKNFARIEPGMRVDEVVATIGASRDTFGLARGRGYVWNYRYVTPHCFWFQIEFASDDTVRSTGYSQPPECRVRAVSAGM
jgi:hypothetical protein